MNYAANIIIEEKGEPVFRKSGVAHIASGKIIFEAEGKSIELPARGCDIVLGGTGNKQAYITHPSKKGITLQVNDFRLFSHDIFRDCTAAVQFKSVKRAHHGRLWSGIAVVAILILVPFYMIFIERDYLIGKIVLQIPPSYDKTLGDLVFAANSGGTLVDDPDILADLERLTASLRKAGDTPPFEYQLHIVNDPAINAFALPGGHIIINTGLIEKTQKPEELLGVIAHEMAHINERHTMKKIMHDVSTKVFLLLLGADPNFVVSTLAQQANFFAARSYSRDAEDEADAHGFTYLTRANINPVGLEDFFKILQDEENAIIDNTVFGWLSTHPLTEDRIDAMDEMMNNPKLIISDYPPVKFDYDGFKKKVLDVAHK